MARFTIGSVDRMGRGTSMAINVAASPVTEDLEALVAAVDAVILGAAASGVVTIPTVIETGSAVPPDNELADRGNKWLLRMQDSTTGKVYTHEMGTADSSQLPAANTDFLALGAGVGAALKTAMEDAWVSPAGNAGVLLSVQQVNRAD
jgi:hypothetical protein